MKINDNKLRLLNETVYNELTAILKKLNKRIYIKIYALVYEKEKASSPIKTFRIKKTVSNGENSTSTSQDVLQTIENVYSELKIDVTKAGNTYEKIKKYLNQDWNNKGNQLIATNREKTTASFHDTEGEEILNSENQINDTRILYVNQMPFNDEKSTCSVGYILEIRNVDQQTRRIFYDIPELSYLRMVLDYFFNDFFALYDESIKINNYTFTTQDTIVRKYNEDGTQFNRRVTRLFFGKMQHYFQCNFVYGKFGSEFENQLTNQYYINSLLEKIDDISTLTYESSSPFGSILFMNKDVITEQSIVRFTVTFTEEDRIRLEDAKRIRKLLELTNVEKDLYLIADENEIYGLGEVKWNLQGDILALRLDFTGLSKYNLVLVRTHEESEIEGELHIENEKKYYRSNLSLIETELVSVSFKNPRLGEEGYSSEKFTSLLKREFWKHEADNDQIKLKIDRLDQVVRKAREQKHGTMVVITEKLIAQQELSKLSKQSTLIEPSIINPDYIKFLTSIDGAIFFDTDGNCHAIGVILDGKSKKDIGDASRGARYNSAHRYLHKLKDDDDKKCVIVIISEDGTVDLIPELKYEDKLLGISEEVIDMINEESYDPVKLREMEEELLQSEIVDSDWLFKIGGVYYRNKDYDKAIEFFECGRKRAEASFIRSQYYNIWGNCYDKNENYITAIDMYKLALKAVNNDQSKAVYLRNIGNSYLKLGLKTKDTDNYRESINWISKYIDLTKDSSIKQSADIFYIRGLCYLKLSEVEKKTEIKNLLLDNSINEYNQAIDMEPEAYNYYIGRYQSYKRLGHVQDCIKDLIQAESLRHDDQYIDELDKLLGEYPDYITLAMNFYKGLVGQEVGFRQLEELITKYEATAESGIQIEEAAVATESQRSEDKK